MRPGSLITLEGGEGAGKSTQAALLSAWLQGCGRRVTCLREPGGTPLGERLRAMLLDADGGDLPPVGEALLFAAARAQAVQTVILPALAGGAVVVCDRFVDSSLAYQGHGLGLDLGFLRTVNEAATAGLTPDLTIVFDIAPEAARARGGARRADRIESRGAAFHIRVRNGYLALAAAESDRIHVVDASRSISDVQSAVRGLVGEHLRGQGPTAPSAP